MNREAIRAIGEILGAIAVFITLALLLKQINLGNAQARQANAPARADSQQDILKQVAEHAKLVVENPGLEADIRSCYKNWEAASTAAKWNFDGWASAYFFIGEQAIYMHNDGLLSDETCLAMEDNAIRIVSTPGGADWWLRRGKHLGAGLSARIDEKGRSRQAHPDWEG